MVKGLKCLLFSCLLLLVLTGCKGPDYEANYMQDYTENPHITADAKLVQIEETTSSNKGLIELRQVNLKKTEQTIGPMELIFYDVKQLRVEPDESMIDVFQPLTNETSFYVVKTFVHIKNTSEETVQFNPAAFAKASTNDSWTWEQEVYLDELNGLYEPGQVKQGNIGFILKNKEEPATFTLQSSDVFDAEQDIVSAGDQVILNLQ